MSTAVESIAAVKRLAGSAWAVRGLVSILTLALVFVAVDPSAVVQALVRVGPSLWLSILAVYLLGHVVAAYKWRALAAPGATFPVALRAHFSGLAANIALPGAASGDLVRAGLLYGRSADRARLAAGSFADRLVDTCGLVMLCIIALLQVRQALDPQTVIWLSGAATAALAAAFAARPILLKLSRSVSPGGKLGSTVRKLAAAGLVLLDNPRRLLFWLAVSMAIQAVFIAASEIIGRAAGVDAALPVWFFAWPLSKLVATIPISAGGIGVREASLAAIMAPFGADPAGVVAAGLTWQSIVILGGLLGSLAAWAMRGAGQHG